MYLFFFGAVMIVVVEVDVVVVVVVNVLSLVVLKNWPKKLLIGAQKVLILFAIVMSVVSWIVICVVVLTVAVFLGTRMIPFSQSLSILFLVHLGVIFVVVDVDVGVQHFLCASPSSTPAHQVFSSSSVSGWHLQALQLAFPLSTSPSVKRVRCLCWSCANKHELKAVCAVLCALSWSM